MKKILIGVGAIIILAIAYYLISPIFNVVELDESSPVSQTILFQGNFQPSEHEVSGKAVLIEDDNKNIAEGYGVQRLQSLQMLRKQSQETLHSAG